jgi:hypothetical protein
VNMVENIRAPYNCGNIFSNQVYISFRRRILLIHLVVYGYLKYAFDKLKLKREMLG